VRPLISVLIPAYNSSKTILEAVESVPLGGTDDYEIILIDDGSDEDVIPLLRSSRVKVRLLRLRENGGLAAALNCGLSVAQGLYIARLDADDRMLPGRLAAQVAALEGDPSLVFCGTQMKMFGDRSGLSRLPTSLTECHGLLLHYCCYTHPTIMIHRERAGADLYYDP
jgi:glycosyltransferase involved in cell wall biosynthesis